MVWKLQKYENKLYSKLDCVYFIFWYVLFVYVVLLLILILARLEQIFENLSKNVLRKLYPPKLFGITYAGRSLKIK